MLHLLPGLRRQPFKPENYYDILGFLLLVAAQILKNLNILNISFFLGVQLLWQMASAILGLEFGKISLHKHVVIYMVLLKRTWFFSSVCGF